MTLLDPNGRPMLPRTAAINLEDHSEVAIRRRAHDFSNIPPPAQPLGPKTALVHAFYRAGLDRALLLAHLDAERDRYTRMVNHYIAGCGCGLKPYCTPHGFAGEVLDPDHFPLCADHDHVAPDETPADA